MPKQKSDRMGLEHTQHTHIPDSLIVKSTAHLAQGLSFFIFCSEGSAAYKNDSLIKFTRKKPFVVNENMPATKALAIMNEKKITSLLVVSEKDLLRKNKVLKGIIHIHFLLQNGIK